MACGNMLVVIQVALFAQSAVADWVTTESGDIVTKTHLPFGPSDQFHMECTVVMAPGSSMDLKKSSGCVFKYYPVAPPPPAPPPPGKPITGIHVWLKAGSARPASIAACQDDTCTYGNDLFNHYRTWATRTQRTTGGKEDDASSTTGWKCAVAKSGFNAPSAEHKLYDDNRCWTNIDFSPNFGVGNDNRWNDWGGTKAGMCIYVDLTAHPEGDRSSTCLKSVDFYQYWDENADTIAVRVDFEDGTDAEFGRLDTFTDKYEHDNGGECDLKNDQTPANNPDMAYHVRHWKVLPADSHEAGLFDSGCPA